MDWTTLFHELTAGMVSLVDEPGRILMMAVGGVLIYLAIAKDYEPTLLLPIGVRRPGEDLEFTGLDNVTAVVLHERYNPSIPIVAGASLVAALGVLLLIIGRVAQRTTCSR